MLPSDKSGSKATGGEITLHSESLDDKSSKEVIEIDSNPSKTNIIQTEKDSIRESSNGDNVPKHLLCIRCSESKRSIMFKECYHWTMCQECSLCIDYCPNCNSKISDRCQDVRTMHCYRCKLNQNEILLSKCDHPILCQSCSECLDFCPLCDKKITDRLSLTEPD